MPKPNTAICPVCSRRVNVGGVNLGKVSPWLTQHNKPGKRAACPGSHMPASAGVRAEYGRLLLRPAPESSPSLIPVS